MKVKDLWAGKKTPVQTIASGNTIYEALCVMTEHGIGSLVVMEDNRVAGIITERDILKACCEAGKAGRPLLERKVAEVMTSDLVIGVPDDTLDYVLGVMIKNWFRHLPIMDGEQLVGLISIRDVVRYRMEEIEVENKYLKDYIANRYPS